MTTSDIDCPTTRNGGGSWDILAPGSSYNLPPACIPPSGKCDTAKGQFWDDGWNDLEEIEVETAGKKGIACACKEARTKGHILKWVDAFGRPDPKNGKLKCVPGGAFLPANAALPTGSGIWVVDTVANATCWDAVSCWDMCFFCDGTKRYSPDVSCCFCRFLIDPAAQWLLEKNMPRVQQSASRLLSMPNMSL
jgi:hypothetical protein